MENIFEKGTRLKVRFSTDKGELTIEDAWTLKLENLDTIAVAIDKKLETSGTKSFIGKRNMENSKLELSLEILKHIISVKLAARDAKDRKLANEAKIAKLKEALMEDENKELLSMSKEDKLKMIADLQSGTDIETEE